MAFFTFAEAKVGTPPFVARNHIVHLFLIIKAFKTYTTHIGHCATLYVLKNIQIQIQENMKPSNTIRPSPAYAGGA